MSGSTSVPTNISSPLLPQSVVWFCLLVAFGSGVVLSSFTGRGTSRIEVAKPSEGGSGFVVPKWEAPRTLHPVPGAAETDGSAREDDDGSDSAEPERGEVQSEGGSPKIEMPKGRRPGGDSAHCCFHSDLPSRVPVT
jgi:hypothetical protein